MAKARDFDSCIVGSIPAIPVLFVCLVALNGSWLVPVRV